MLYSARESSNLPELEATVYSTVRPSYPVTLENSRVLYPRSSEHKLDSPEPYNKSSSARSAKEQHQPSEPVATAEIGEVDYESLPTNNLWQHLLAGAMAGIMEHCCMYPVDCVKVGLMQCLQCIAYGIGIMPATA